MRYTVQPLATFSSCCLMTVFTSADRDDWLATKITVAKETCGDHSRGGDEIWKGKKTCMRTRKDLTLRWLHFYV